MNLEQRLERLELQNRRLKMVGLIGLLAVLSVVLMGQAETVPEEIKAKTFIAVDDAGNERVLLGSTAGGYGLDLFDYAGRIRMKLVVDEGFQGRPTFSSGGEMIKLDDGTITFEPTTGTLTQDEPRIAQHASLLLYDAGGAVIYLLEE